VQLAQAGHHFGPIVHVRQAEPRAWRLDGPHAKRARLYQLVRGFWERQLSRWIVPTLMQKAVEPFLEKPEDRGREYPEVHRRELASSQAALVTRRDRVAGGCHEGSDGERPSRTIGGPLDPRDLVEPGQPAAGSLTN